MRARLYRYRTGDAAALDGLLDYNRAGDVRLDSDRIIVVEPGNNVGSKLSGALVWRPAGFIHELVVKPGLSRRLAATALVNYALGDGTSRDFKLAQAVFVVDSRNHAMLRFVRETGATEQPPSTVFLLDL